MILLYNTVKYKKSNGKLHLNVRLDLKIQRKGFFQHPSFLKNPAFEDSVIRFSVKTPFFNSVVLYIKIYAPASTHKQEI